MREQKEEEEKAFSHLVTHHPPSVNGAHGEWPQINSVTGLVSEGGDSLLSIRVLTHLGLSS